MTEENLDQVEVEEVVDTEADIRDAFDEAITNESEEDDIKMSMIGAGATFKNVTRLYNQFMIDAGLAISKADRNQIVDDTLKGRDLDTEESFDAAVEGLMEAIKGATERSAGSLIRAYAKKNELEVYAKPKTESGSRNPFVQIFHTKLVEDPNMTEQGLRDIIDGLDEDHQTNPNRWFSQHNNIRKTANAIAARYEG